MSAAVALPFDEVVISEGDERKVLSPDEFFALPLAVRIGHVIQERACFYDRQKQVDARTVLAEVRRLRARA
jgi:hypothetical protein